MRPAVVRDHRVQDFTARETPPAFEAERTRVVQQILEYLLGHDAFASFALHGASPLLACKKYILVLRSI